MPRSRNRRRDARNGFSLPPRVRWRTATDLLRHPQHRVAEVARVVEGEADLVRVAVGAERQVAAVVVAVGHVAERHAIEREADTVLIEAAHGDARRLGHFERHAGGRLDSHGMREAQCELEPVGPPPLDAPTEAPLERCRDGLPEWFEGNIDTACVAATGGSTNHTLHLVAIARAASDALSTGSRSTRAPANRRPAVRLGLQPVRL